MERNKFLDTSVKSEGDQIVNDQIIDSYHCGVIDSERHAFTSEVSKDQE